MRCPRQIYERHPDYLFGRTNLALHLIRNGQNDEAEALLQPLYTRQRLHISEFSALMNAQIELFIARNDLKSARSCLDMWAGADPDHPAVEKWQRRLARPGGRQRPARPRGLVDAIPLAIRLSVLSRR